MVKDKNAPKRPLSGYFLFTAEIRAKTQKANKNASMTELSGIMAKQWKELSDAQKKPYQAKAAKAKAVYQKKMEAYKKTDSYKNHQAKSNVKGLIKKICKKYNIDCKKRNPTKFPADPSAPKRAPSGFFLFGASVRPALQKKLAGKPVSEVAKKIGEQWKNLSETEQSKFQKKAEKLKAGVAAEQKKYAKTTSAKNYAAARKEFAKERKAALKA